MLLHHCRGRGLLPGACLVPDGNDPSRTRFRYWPSSRDSSRNQPHPPRMITSFWFIGSPSPGSTRSTMNRFQGVVWCGMDTPPVPPPPPCFPILFLAGGNFDVIGPPWVFLRRNDREGMNMRISNPNCGFRWPFLT
ncbi:unnamed protein product [Ectocarpus sp. 13 AM-2016]